ncbi:MAG: hypothetical protein ACRDT6_23390 [Micromonosporaceae bacterium]
MRVTPDEVQSFFETVLPVVAVLCAAAVLVLGVLLTLHRRFGKPPVPRRSDPALGGPFILIGLGTLIAQGSQLFDLPTWAKLLLPMLSLAANGTALVWILRGRKARRVDRA